jgi:Aerotolerance regulator N-terminal/von Willebrand factor type A domain
VGLGFLSPLFLIGLAAAAVPILIHLFRRQPDPVMPFSAVRFLQRAPAEQARRRRLREWLLLALRTAALVLLALSFARPYFQETRAEAAAPVRVVAIDASYSVSTLGQVERARTLAAQAVDGAPDGHLVAVVRFDEQAEVVLPPTADRARARGVLRRVDPGVRATRYSAALAAASELTAGRGGSLVIVSDLQRAGWTGEGAAAPRGLQVEALDVGAPGSNLSVAMLQRAREGAVVGLRNSGETDRQARVTLGVGDRVVAEQTVTVLARGSSEVAVRAALPAEGGMTASVVDAEGYAADNVRHAVLDLPVRPRVLVVAGSSSAAGGDAFYLERAIAAAEGPSGLKLERITAERAGSDQALRDAAAVVLLASAGLDRRAADAVAEAVAQGAGLFVAAGPSLELPRVAAQLPSALGVRAGRAEEVQEPLTFAPADVRHPVFRAFSREPGLLGAARFHRIVRWGDGRQARTLARFSNGAPALVEVQGTGGRVLHFASDLANAWNDFALHPAFVPFVHDVVRYLVSGRAPAAEYLVGAWPGAEGLRPGIVTVPAGPGSAVRRVAINVDLREADQARLTPAAFVAAVPRTGAAARPPALAAARQRESEQSLWRYGLMLMLLGLAVESVVGRRS